MANIRINNLPPEPNPQPTDVVPIDGATTRKATLAAVATSVRPFASQAEAEAGVDNTKTMTPLSSAQAIAAIGGGLFATTTQGAKADTAVQPTRQVNTGTGLTGGGDLSANRTIELNAASIASLAKADTAVQPSRTISAGTGLTGGGDLSANRTLSVDPNVLAATLPVGGATGQTLRKASNADYDTEWSNPPGGGDMLASVYDPTNVAADAFNRTNFHGITPISGGGTGASSAVGGFDALAARGSDVPTAATLNLDSANAPVVDLTGSVTVTAVTLTSGRWRIARAAGAFQITAGASLIVNGSVSVSFTTIGGDLLLFQGYAAGVVRVWLIGNSGRSILPGLGTAGQLLRVNSSGSALEYGANITLATPQATTSGTGVTFSSIPASVRQIAINFSGVSVSGTANLFIQIGDAGGVEGSGYLGSGNFNGGTATNFTLGFGVVSATAANVIHGTVFLTLIDPSANTWAASGTLAISNSAGVINVAGTKSLSAILDRVFIAPGGADTFDAGSINIAYH